MLQRFLARFRGPDWRKLPGAPSPGERICLLSELEDGLPRYVQIGPENFLCFLTLRGSRVRAFVASCPHKDRAMGSANMAALYGDGEIACHHHGALFSVDSGVCTSGPCKGARLCELPVHSDATWVLVGQGPSKA